MVHVKIPELKPINFEDEITESVARALKDRLEHNRFQVLNMMTGHGKTAIAVKMVGLIADELQTDVNIFLISTKSKLNERSWDATINQYNEKHRHKVVLAEKSTDRGILIASQNDDYTKVELEELKEKENRKIHRMKFLKKWIKMYQDIPTVIIVDEVHKFKNPVAKQSKAFTKLIKALPKGIGLSATPMSNGKIQDGVSYLVYNGKYNSKNAFLNENIPKWVPKDKYYRPMVTFPNGDINPTLFNDVEKFDRDIKEVIFKPIVPQNFDIPNVEGYTYTYDLSELGAQRLADCARDYRKRKYDNYMQYLSDNSTIIGEDIAHARMLAKCLLQFKPKQPLIFYSNNRELATIEFALQKMNMDYSLVNGRNSISKVDKSNLNQAIVLQYVSGSEAVEFPESNLTIFYGLTYSWELTKQGMGRNVRRGQTHTVKQIMLVCTVPHDERVYDKLMNKQEFTEELQEQLAEEIAEDYK
ncbi:DEAD/DEAH box helicase family protein [Staphylococcus capitis]|uniref:DEAD/DEAH box helicase family protein n=1 Tax=Staphylococcus TaxID=1279 RepID=UPI0022F14543|nr:MULTISPECIES: DEAD/DEAH box helicase family protein [Staphylococcus]MCG1060630.1 DEAD/DEAH box helicase family protein [Staphylococcus epidermidis]MDH9600744.1 DEAD/DEAH box helicase family protein [Staphylococcus capitis]MDH9624342.1 DEAD/DEAH box helicase family protein [Staphylococcus capitis]